jgi:hypothetical protein
VGLHTHFEVDRYFSTRIDVTPNVKGEHDVRAAVAERTFELILYYFMGLASEEERIADLEKLKRHEQTASINE